MTEAADLTTLDAEPIVCAYRARDGWEARALAAHLMQEGVAARVVGEALQGAYAGLHVGGMSDAEVWIRAGDRPRAAELLADWRAQQAARRPPPASASAAPGGVRYSLRWLLGLTTAVAALSAATGLGWFGLSDWPTVICNVLFVGLAVFVGARHARLVWRRWSRRDAND